MPFVVCCMYKEEKVEKAITSPAINSTSPSTANSGLQPSRRLLNLLLL